jgi:CheY-like chemotaxis protein
VEIFSEPGRGSRFSVTVPRIEATAQVAAEVAAESADAAALERRTVLLVEDDPAARTGLSNLLRSWQCDVLEVDGTEAALACVAHLDRGPDVIIADFRLHGTDCGTTTVRAVRMKCGRDVPALIVSGDQSSGLRTAARETGAMFLVKPVPPSKLRATLNYLMSRSDAT